MADGTEPVDPSEIIYRRIIRSIKGGHYNPDRPQPLSHKAFGPRPIDTDGISFLRQKYVSSPEQAAAEGAIGHEYWIIEMLAGDLEGVGVKIEPAPLEDCIGHAVAPTINASNGDQSEVLAAMDRARNLKYKPFGPFPGKKPPSAVA